MDFVWETNRPFIERVVFLRRLRQSLNWFPKVSYNVIKRKEVQDIRIKLHYKYEPDTPVFCFRR